MFYFDLNTDKVKLFGHINSLAGDRYMYLGKNTFFKRSKKKDWNEHQNISAIHG